MQSTCYLQRRFSILRNSKKREKENKLSQLSLIFLAIMIVTIMVILVILSLHLLHKVQEMMIIVHLKIEQSNVTCHEHLTVWTLQPSLAPVLKFAINYMSIAFEVHYMCIQRRGRDLEQKTRQFLEDASKYKESQNQIIQNPKDESRGFKI